MFFARFFRTRFWHQAKLQVTSKKLPKRRLYEKRAQKRLMKLTQGPVKSFFVNWPSFFQIIYFNHSNVVQSKDPCYDYFFFTYNLRRNKKLLITFFLYLEINFLRTSLQATFINHLFSHLCLTLIRLC